MHVAHEPQSHRQEGRLVGPAIELAVLGNADQGLPERCPWVVVEEVGYSNLVLECDQTELLGRGRKHRFAARWHVYLGHLQVALLILSNSVIAHAQGEAVSSAYVARADASLAGWLGPV